MFERIFSWIVALRWIVQDPALFLDPDEDDDEEEPDPFLPCPVEIEP